MSDRRGLGAIGKPPMDLDIFFDHPEKIGHEVGFADLTDLHGEWIKKMVFGGKDYTLQAHRGSFKSSCLAVAIAILLVYYPERNIIFLRKTDSDVSEMLGMVSKILHSVFFFDLVKEMHGKELAVEGESMNHLSTNLWNSPMGAPQLLGLGIPSGTKAEVLQSGENWSRIRVGNRTGWMMSRFLVADDGDVPAEPELSETDIPEPEPGNDEAQALLSEIYQVLRDLCEKIENTVGVG